MRRCLRKTLPYATALMLPAPRNTQYGTCLNLATLEANTYLTLESALAQWPTEEQSPHGVPDELTGPISCTSATALAFQ